MKSPKIFAVLILLLAVLSGITACGNDTPADTGAQASSAAPQGATVNQQTQEEVSASIDANAGADKFLGDWKDINDAERFAKITKTDTGYRYEDNEGKYPATFTDGIMLVKVSEEETADVYIDAETGHLFLVYQGNPSEFTRK